MSTTSDFTVVSDSLTLDACRRTDCCCCNFFGCFVAEIPMNAVTSNASPSYSNVVEELLCLSSAMDLKRRMMMSLEWLSKTLSEGEAISRL